jgi:RNA polymerase-binding transcription factor DksA
MAINEALRDEMKQSLIDEKNRLESELSRFATKTDVPGDYETRHDEIGSDRDENATEVEMYVDNIALEESLEKELREVDQALAKAEAGAYGACEECGADIEEGRLRAYPAASTCMAHAK